MNFIQDNKRRIADQIANTYGHQVRNENDIIKGAENQLDNEEKIDLQKGKKDSAPIGTIKEFGGRPFIKTADGWRYHGKGTGAKAKEHAASAGKPHMDGVGTTGAVRADEVDHDDAASTEKFAKRRDSKELLDYLGKEGGDDKAKEAAKAELKARGVKLPDEEESKGDDKEGAKKDSDAGPKISEKEAEKVADDESYDINERFKAFQMFARNVIKGRMKSMIAYGSGGVGKTYTVTQEMKAAGKREFDEDEMEPGDNSYDYVKITGKSTAAGVYQALYKHNGKIIMFDDNDSVLKNDDAVNFFKGALDTSGDGTINYGSAKALKDDDGVEMPKRFKFSGRVIFISNLPPDQIPQPLKSRGYNVDLTMNKKQTMDRIHSIATDKASGEKTNLKFPGIEKYSHDDMQEILDHLDKNKDKMKADLSVRTIGALLGIKQESDELGEDWKTHAKHMLFSKGEEDTIQKSFRENLLKSYGIDRSKRTFYKSEAVQSNTSFGMLEKSIEDNIQKSEAESAEDELIK